MDGTDRNPLDKLFRESLNEAELSPPAYAWDRLQAELGAGRRRKAAIWWRVAAAAALLVIGFGAGYLLSDIPEVDGQLAEQPSRPLEEPDNTDRKENPGPEAFSAAAGSSSGYNGSTAGPAGHSSSEIHTEAGGTSGMQSTGFASATEKSLSGEAGENVPAQATLALHDPEVVKKDENFQEPSGQVAGDRSMTEVPSTLAIISVEIDPSLPRIRQRNTYAGLMLDPAWLREAVQEDVGEPAQWKLGGEIAPLLAFAGGGWNAQEDAELVTNSATSFSSTGKEKPLMSYTAGVQASMSLLPRLALSAGIGYSRMGQSTEDAALAQDISNYWGPLNIYSLVTGAGVVQLSGVEAAQIDQGTGTLGSSGEQLSDIVQQFDYLELPLMLETRLVDRAVKLSVETGLQAGILVGNKAYVISGDERLELSGTEGLRPVLWSGVTSLGLHLPVGEGWHIALKPGLRYALAPLNSDPAFGYQPWSVSVGAGLSYQLR